uniref:PAS domain S-box protein n=1 Tax=candidate division WOR-3 bacterium TaxID=2052148 RepID=A0A7V3VU73_UNCW3
MKVLLIDDSVERISLLKDVLSGAGYDVKTATNCIDAFKILYENGFELIITSILHPIYEGLSLCYRLKRDDKTKGIPVIIYTQVPFDKSDIEFLSNLGADVVIDFSKSETEIVSKVKNLIENIQTGTLKVKSPISGIEKGLLQTYSRHFLEKFEGVSAKYQTLFESAADGIMILKDYKFVECNRKALEMFGCRAEDIMGKYPYEFSPEIQPDGMVSKEKAIRMMDEALRGNPILFEWRHKRLEGSLFDTEVSLRRFDLHDGVYLLALVRDITERKRMEEQLRKSEEMFRTVFNSALDCIFIKNRALRYVMVNKFAAEIFGLSQEDFIGKLDTEIFGEEQAKIISAEDQRVLHGETVELISKRMVKGVERVFHFIKVPLYDEKGEIWGLCGIARDITEMEKIREDLVKSQERLRLISDNITEVIFILNMDLKFMYLTPSIKIIGYEIKELLENGIEKLLTRESYLDVMKVLKEELEIERLPVKDTKRYRSLLLQMKKKDGSTIWAETSFKFIRGEDDKPVGILGVARDVTETYEAHQELNRSYKQLDRLLEGAVTALAAAVEKRDPYTAGHQRRVTELCQAIAREMGLSENVIHYLRIAGLLHDVGKIYVPAEILAKPATLTPAEFEIIKTHPQVGYEILKPVDFPWPIPEIVLQHHEKNDGSGYPQGLTGDKIMLEAKILCVADIVEAMMSHRPYRPALGIDQALEDINKGRGIKFDPEIVDICIKLFREKGFRFSK